MKLFAPVLAAPAFVAVSIAVAVAVALFLAPVLALDRAGIVAAPPAAFVAWLFVAIVAALFFVQFVPRGWQRPLSALAFVDVALAALVLASPLALAQQPDPGGQAVDFVCAHKATIAPLLTVLLIHFGCSSLSAVAKKVGLADSPLVGIVRLFALDLKPAGAPVPVPAAPLTEGYQPRGPAPGRPPTGGSSATPPGAP